MAVVKLGKYPKEISTFYDYNIYCKKALSIIAGENVPVWP
jgi:hypothetical protein